MRHPDHQLFSSLTLALGVLTWLAVGQPALADPEETTIAPETGAQTYNAVCIACHAPPGIGGAPALGDVDAWAPRIAQGIDTLIDHALNGYSGRTGIMPMKGGRVDLSDEEIIAAIDFMIAQVGQ